MTMHIVKAGPGIDPEGALQERLGDGFHVHEYDEDRPLSEQVAHAHVLLIRDVPITRAVIEAAPGLKLLQRMGANLVDVDVAHALQRGVHVARIPASPLSSRMLAEHALFLMLALAKRLKESQLTVAAGRIGDPMTDGLQGKRLGIVGLGRSGGQLAQLAKGIGMRVSAVKRTPDAKTKDELGLDFLGNMEARDAMLGDCDYVSLHVPLNDETRGSFGEAAFAAMPEGSRLINVARAGIVDRGALEQALRSGHLAGAAFDVFWNEPASPDDPLLARADFLLTPHLGAFTRDARARMISATAENIRRVADGEPPLNLVTSA